MTCTEHEKIAAFDTLFSNNHIQILKVMLPYLDNPMQKFGAIYIKLLELQYTIKFCQKHSDGLWSCTNQDSSANFSNLCNELSPFLNIEEKKQIEQIQNMLHAAKMYREISKTMESMKEFMPDMEDMFQNIQADSFSGFPFSKADADAADSSSDTSSQKSNASAPIPGFDMTNMLMNMLTPEQKEMVELLKGEDIHVK